MKAKHDSLFVVFCLTLLVSAWCTLADAGVNGRDAVTLPVAGHHVAKEGENLSLRIGQISTQSFPQLHAYVAVEDAVGGSITGPEWADFDVWEDPEGRGDDLAPVVYSIAPLTDETAPLSVALVLDRSGSMDGEPMAQAKAAAREFLTHFTDEDQCGIVSFAGDVSIVPDSGLTNTNGEGRLALSRAIDEISAGGVKFPPFFGQWLSKDWLA